MTGDKILEVDKLSVQIGRGADAFQAVSEISLSIGMGETLALLGESGCGKSMTALALLGVLPPAGNISGGTVKLDSTDMTTLSAKQLRAIRGGRIGFIFQDPMTSLNPLMTVGAQIAEVVTLHKGLRGSQRQARVFELLAAVGIADAEHRFKAYPHQLSGGMKQRVMIAMALAGDPDVLIADEPTTSLDVTIQAQVLALIAEQQKQRGMAMLLITHDLGIVAGMADRVAVMYAGQLVEQAARARFFHAPQHPYSRKLFDAVPEARKRDQRLKVIPGTVPALNRRFEGCRFAERCDRVMDMCRSQPPEWTETAPGHAVRCHLMKSAQIPVSDCAEDSADTCGFHPVNEQRRKARLSVTGLKVHFPIHKGLFKRTAGYIKAVDGVSLDIPAGRTVALVGESGCGKTTVGKSILQLIKPSAGSVDFEGQELTQLDAHQLRQCRRHVQMIFQDPFAAMNPRMRIGDIIEEGMLVQRIGDGADNRRARVERLIEQVGLHPEQLQRYAHEFSGGQRQRICIARALAVNPKLIICDEPTSALDVSVQAQIVNLLRDLQSAMALSYLFITHDISLVSYLADRVAVMYLGRIVEQGGVEEVLKSPQHPYTRELLAAVPTLDPERGRKVIRLEGDIPSPANPPQGCHFHPRCPHATPACKQVYPQFIDIKPGHRVRCLLFQTHE